MKRRGYPNANHEKEKVFSTHYSKEMIELLPAGEGGLCLDIGCGKGDSRYPIEFKGYKWVGLDIRPSNNLSVTGDAHKLPFKNQSFDLVISTAVIEHLHSPMIALNEVNRVLKTGRIFFGSVAFLEPWHDNSYFHFSHLGIVTMLKDCGFMVERMWPGWHGLEALLKGLIYCTILMNSINIPNRGYEFYGSITNPTSEPKIIVVFRNDNLSALSNITKETFMTQGDTHEHENTRYKKL